MNRGSVHFPWSSVLTVFVTLFFLMPSYFWPFMTKIVIQKSPSIRQFFTPSEIVGKEKLLDKIKCPNLHLSCITQFQSCAKLVERLVDGRNFRFQSC